MKIIFHGKVQGVGFRYFTYKTALKYNIGGSVKNLADGTVELIINDKSKNIKSFLEEIKKGNGIMDIEKMEKREYKCSKKDFDITY